MQESPDEFVYIYSPWPIETYSFPNLVLEHKQVKYMQLDSVERFIEEFGHHRRRAVAFLDLHYLLLNQGT